MHKEPFFSEQMLNELQQKYPITKSSTVDDKLRNEVKNWFKDMPRFLVKENPFILEQKQFDSAQKSLLQNIATTSAIEDDFECFESLSIKTNSPIDKRFWLAQINKSKNQPKLAMLVDKFNDPKRTKRQTKNKNSNTDEENNLICRRLLQQQWQKLLEQQHSQWMLNAIVQYRREFIAQLSHWLDMLQQLNNVLTDLSIEPGLLLDLSKGNLSLSNLEQLKRWAKYISEDKGVRKLCDLMGRLNRAAKSKRQEQIKTTITIPETIPDINSKEEIIGIHIGRHIEHALPHELALLIDEQTAILFDKKFIEGQLMCFDMQGMIAQDKTHEIQQIVEIQEDIEQGPVIICVDTSGSMQGAPETIAKAITLFMATRAIKQKRACFLINFSTQIETLDLSGNIGILHVIEFLQRSFRGGTDASPALAHALKIMEKESYNKADLLMISDFLMASTSTAIQEKIATAKLNNNKFYSLAIGELFLDEKLTSIFNQEWVYSPSNSSIHAIENIIDVMSPRA